MDQTAQLRPGFFALAMRRRWRIVVAGLVLGLLAGVGALTQLPVTYTSQAKLYLNPLIGNPYAPDLGDSRTDQLTALQTEAELIPTSRVRDLAVARSAEPLPESPEENLNVSVPSNSTVIVLLFSASQPAVATAGAQAFADAYLEYRGIRAAESNASSADLLRADLLSTATVVDDTKAQLAAAESGSATELQLQGQLEVYADKLADLTLSLNEALGTIPPAGEVISPATSTLSPSGLPAWLLLAAALIAGLGLGVVIALAREHADDHLRDADELTALGVGHPLATVAVGAGAFSPRRPAPSGYRLLLTAVTARAGLDTPVTCVVGRRAAAEEVAAGIAATAYRLGRPAIAMGIDQPPSWDVAKVLPARAIVEANGRVLTPYQETATLVVVPFDPEADAAEEFVLSAALPRFVTGARTTGSLVALAGGSSSSATGQTLASIADLTLVVVELGRDTFTEVVEIVETLQESGVENVGLVVASADRSNRGLLARLRGALPGSTRPTAPQSPPASTTATRVIEAQPAGILPPATPSASTAPATAAKPRTPAPPAVDAPSAARPVAAPGSARR